MHINTHADKNFKTHTHAIKSSQTQAKQTIKQHC